MAEDHIFGGGLVSLHTTASRVSLGQDLKFPTIFKSVSVEATAFLRTE